jgi:hypothetical protein
MKELEQLKKRIEQLEAQLKNGGQENAAETLSAESATVRASDAPLASTKPAERSADAAISSAQAAPGRHRSDASSRPKARTVFLCRLYLADRESAYHRVAP